MFQANNDPTHASRQCLSRAIFARFIRLHPAKTTRKHEALRVDFRGYDVGMYNYLDYCPCTLLDVRHLLSDVI